MVLSALGLLALATGDRAYIDEAMITADAVIKFKTRGGVLYDHCDLPEASRECNPDQVGLSQPYSVLT